MQPVELFEMERAAARRRRRELLPLVAATVLITTKQVTLPEVMTLMGLAPIEAETARSEDGAEDDG